MKTLTEIESMCQRILGVLEHDDLRSGDMVVLANMLTRLREDLKLYLANWRAVECYSPELRAAEDALGALNNHVLWLQEYAGVKPVVEGSQKLRMASLLALRIVTLLQDEATITDSSTQTSVHARPSTTVQFATRA